MSPSDTTVAAKPWDGGLLASLAVVLLCSLSGPRHAQDPAADAPATTLLRLKSGAIAFGSIVGHDAEHLRFRRLETGGEVELPWGFLDPTESAELRLALGYVETEAEEVLVDADRLELADGKEVIGRIVNRTDEHLWVKRAEGTVPIAKTNVRGAVTAVQAPALDIFTKEELYQQKAFELQGVLPLEGRAGAQAHDELARYAEGLLDYPHALEHYQAAAERDPTYDAERLAAAVARATEKAALQGQVDLLSEIDLARARKRYDKALADLDSFPTLYPKSPLLEDWNRLRERVARSQERDLREEVVTRWHYWSVRLAREAARESTYEGAVAYLDEKMGQDVAERVRDDVQTILPGIDADRVRRFWSERKGGKVHSATYGLGTWLLGESARAELDQKKEEAEGTKEAEPEKGSQSAERKRLEERIKRYLENQKLTRGSSSGGASKEEDPQVFWDGWNFAGRAQWILAHYAEKSGDFRDLQARLSNCRDCGGTGAREILFTGSAIQDARAGEVLVPCPTCRTFGVVRRIRYR